MAHAAPASSGRGTGARHPGPRPPGDTARAHPALREGRTPPTARRLTTAAWSLPLLLGILYGLWAAQIDRNTGNPRYAGPISTGNVVFGVVSGLVVAALCFLLHQVSPRLPREGRALSWALFAGAAFGYLYSLTTAPVFRTVVIAILTAGGVFAMTFYRYYTSE